MNKREFKDHIYGELAIMAKAMANPHRLEIIDLLAQGPFSVEQIAGNTGMSVANTSQHLQALKNARLVSVRRDGNFLRYSLAGPDVYRTWIALRELGMAFNATIEKVLQDFRQEDTTETIDAPALLRLLEKDDTILIDVRPEEEYRRGHIHRAISMPVDQLRDRPFPLPKDRSVIVYCRGPFCVYADEAVALLRQQGYRASRLREGYPEWALAGYPVDKTA